MGRPFGCLVHYRGSKTVKDCELKYGGHLSRNVPERCMFTSSQKLFHDSSKQQDLRRFLEEVSYLHESLIRDYTILRYILMPESCTISVLYSTLNVYFVCVTRSSPSETLE